MINSKFAFPLALPPADGGTAPLDPTQLGDLATAAEQALLRQGESENTLRSYRSALRYWGGWFALRYGRPIDLPVPAAVVVQFIVDHTQRLDAQGQLISELPAAVDQALLRHGFKARQGPIALSTVTHRIAVLSKLHQLQRAPNPCEEPRVRELLSHARRGHAKRGALPRKKPAMTRSALEAVLATCDESLTGQRDRALLLFAFSSGGRRRSEVTAATLENTRRDGARYVFTLATSKTNQAGDERPENDKPIAGRAATALTQWLEVSRISSGAIFRRVRRGGLVGEPLASAAVNDILKRRCALAGLSGAYSAHSLRSGFATEAAHRGIPLGEAMAMTGHRTVGSLVGYYRSSGDDSLAARLMDA